MEIAFNSVVPYIKPPNDPDPWFHPGVLLALGLYQDFLTYSTTSTTIPKTHMLS
jgi:hypothetical protein